MTRNETWPAPRSSPISITTQEYTMQFARRLLTTTLGDPTFVSATSGNTSAPAHTASNPYGATGWLVSSPWEGLYVVGNE